MVFGNGSKMDLVVAGPNEGANAGPSLYTVSGTVGATYAAIEKGVRPLSSESQDPCSHPTLLARCQVSPSLPPMEPTAMCPSLLVFLMTLPPQQLD